MAKRKKYDRESLLENHPKWLSKMNYRCQFTGKTIGKRVLGSYRRYNFHHTCSGAYGREKPGYNYLLLTPWAHWFAHFLGGVLIPGRSVTIQNRRAERLPLSYIWEMPNPAQTLFHSWCRLPFFIRHVVAFAAIVLALIELNT